VPEDAKPNTPKGATAFARWYVEQSSQASVDWDTGVIETYADPTCTVCKDLVSNIRTWQKKGYSNPVRRYVFNSSQVGPGSASGVYVVDLLGKEESRPIYDTNRKVVGQQPAEDSALRVTVRRVNPVWRVHLVQAIVR